MKRFIRFISVVCMLTVLVTAVPAHATTENPTYQVGDDVEFNAYDSDGSVTGSVESSSSSNAVFGTTSESDWTMSYRTGFIQEAHKTTNPYTRMAYKDNSYVLTYRDTNSTPWTIETLTSSSSMTLSGSKHYDADALGVLGDNLPSYTRSDIDNWSTHVGMFPEYTYRTVTVAGKTLYYVTDYEERIELLDKYFDICGWDESYDLLYICEYTIQDVERGVIYGQTPATWYGTNSTHFWEMECFDFETNESLGHKQAFSDNKLTQSFAVAGRYHITATQILSQTMCDVAVWRRREYLVEPYLGLIIWAKTSSGSNLSKLDTNVPLAEQMDTIYHEMVYNPRSGGEAKYLTQYDAWIDIVDTGPGTPPPSPWGDEYDTERIE